MPDMETEDLRRENEWLKEENQNLRMQLDKSDQAVAECQREIRRLRLIIRGGD